MKYLCSVGYVVEARNEDEAILNFLALDLPRTTKHDVDCIEYDLDTLSDEDLLNEDLVNAYLDDSDEILCEADRLGHGLLSDSRRYIPED